MIGTIMSNSATAPSRVSTVEFLAIGVYFTNHVIKTSVKKTSRSIAAKLSKKTN